MTDNADVPVVSSASLAALLDLSPDGVVLVDAWGVVVRANAEADRIFGCGEGGLIGRVVESMLPADTRARHRAFRRDYMGSPRNREMAERTALEALRDDGTTVPVRVSLVPLRAIDGPLVAAIVRDLSSVQRLERDARLWADVFERAHWGVVVSSADGSVFSHLNPAFARMHGFTVDELIGRPITAVFAPEERDGVLREIARAHELGHHRWESVHVRKDGTRFPVLVDLTVIRDEQGRVLHRAANVVDITEQKRREAALSAATSRAEHLATHDAVTGLPNRAVIEDRVGHARERARRDGRRIAVLFIDLDDFKKVNDSLGHAAGDRVLVEVAARIRGCLRASDSAARHGGDEFVVVLEDLAGDIGLAAAQAADVATRIEQLLAHDITVDGVTVHVDASIGIAVSSDANEAAEDLIRQADTAMYEAKRRNTGSHVLFDDRLRARRTDRVALEAELRDALRRDELRVHYQPIVDLRSRAVVGAEALLRWQHPNRGLLLPAAFLDVAEHTGLIAAIGHKVLEDSCATLAAWHHRAPRQWPFITVNVARRQLSRGDLPTTVLGLRERYGLPPHALHLEITETTLLDTTGAEADQLERLVDAGVPVGLDDFGTGYGSLTYLRRFRIGFVKIDKSFVRGLGKVGSDTAIVDAVVRLGRALNVSVIAEGVERADQAAALHRLGCHHGQGWLFGRAEPPEALLDAATRDVPGAQAREAPTPGVPRPGVPRPGVPAPRSSAESGAEVGGASSSASGDPSDAPPVEVTRPPGPSRSA